jgi:hypothetical protein
MDGAREVGKGLVDGDPLDEGREITQHLDGGIAQPLVVLEMAVDKNESQTPPAEGRGNPRSLMVGSTWF